MSLRRSLVDSDELIRHRFLFALKPSAGAVAEMAEVRGKVGTARSHVFDDRLHLTLWLLDLPMMPPSGIIADLCRAASGVRWQALRVVLHEVVSNRSNTCLKPGEPMPVLKAFQKRLQLAIADVGIYPKRGFRFDPHVTLAYGQEEGFRHQVWPISWRAEEFVLIRSLVGLTEHVELGRWALEG